MNKSIVFKNEEYTKEDIDKVRKMVPMYTKLRKIFEDNLFKTGDIEISSIQLSEATGKEPKQINRDIRAEFGDLEIYSNILQENQNLDMYGRYLLREGINELSDKIRIVEERDVQNKSRNVYILKGVAITQLITRWDKVTRFLINLIIHNLSRNVEEISGFRPQNLGELDTYYNMTYNLVTRIKLLYAKKQSEVTHEHIIKNYRSLMDEILKYEGMMMASRKIDPLEAINMLKGVVKGIKQLDQDNENLLEREEESALFGEEVAEELYSSR